MSRCRRQLSSTMLLGKKVKLFLLRFNSSSEAKHPRSSGILPSNKLQALRSSLISVQKTDTTLGSWNFKSSWAKHPQLHKSLTWKALGTFRKDRYFSFLKHVMEFGVHQTDVSLASSPSKFTSSQISSGKFFSWVQRLRYRYFKFFNLHMLLGSVSMLLQPLKSR